MDHDLDTISTADLDARASLVADRDLAAEALAGVDTRCDVHGPDCWFDDLDAMENELDRRTEVADAHN